MPDDITTPPPASGGGTGTGTGGGDITTFESEKERINKEARELQNIFKQGLVDKEATQETFAQVTFDAEQQRLKDLLDLYIKYGEDTSIINGQILDNELEMIDKKAAREKKVAEDKLKQNQTQIDNAAALGDQLINLAGEDEKMQAIRKAGIQISSAAAIANNLLALSNAAVGVTEQSKLVFPANIIAMANDNRNSYFFISQY